MLRGNKKFIFCLGLGCILFTIFNYISTPESANAAMIDIRDGRGHVTTWGWWLVNIFAPFFILFELVKILLGILFLPLALFGVKWGFEFLAAGWSNLIIMWPGLLVWGILSLFGENIET